MAPPIPEIGGAMSFSKRFVLHVGFCKNTDRWQRHITNDSRWKQATSQVVLLVDSQRVKSCRRVYRYWVRIKARTKFSWVSDPDARSDVVHGMMWSGITPRAKNSWPMLAVVYIHRGIEHRSRLW